MAGYFCHVAAHRRSVAPLQLHADALVTVALDWVLRSALLRTPRGEVGDVLGADTSRART